jgi:hypothetical protein
MIVAKHLAFRQEITQVRSAGMMNDRQTGTVWIARFRGFRLSSVVVFFVCVIILLGILDK